MVSEGIADLVQVEFLLTLLNGQAEDPQALKKFVSFSQKPLSPRAAVAPRACVPSDPLDVRASMSARSEGRSAPGSKALYTSLPWVGRGTAALEQNAICFDVVG